MNKAILIRILKLVITIGIFVFIFSRFSVKPGYIISKIVDVKYLFLVVIIPLFILPIISSNRWKLFLSQVGISEKTLNLIKINWISIFQGIILPSSQGQDLLRIYYIEQKHPDKKGIAGSTIIIERLIGIVLLSLIGFIASIFVTVPNKEILLLVISGINFLLILIVLFLLNKKIYGFFSSKIASNRSLRIINYLDNIYRTIAFFPYRKIILSSVFLILFYQATTILCVSWIFKAYGINIPFYYHLSFFPIISILSMLPITISGLGIREGFFAFFYTQIGVSSEIAIIVSLFNYILIVILPALLGGTLYLFDIIKRK